MGLVDKRDIAKVAHLEKVGMSVLAKPIMDILRISDVNEVYAKFEELRGLAFIDAVLDEYRVSFDYFPEELRRIPKEGPFIAVANHPLGGIDGILLIKLISQIRPDFKVMANFLLQKIEPLKDFFMPVNPFDNKDLRSSFTGIKESMAHVEAGMGLGIFPAGEVSTYQFERRKVSDKPWEEGALRFIQKMDVPVVPVFFQARNSAFFYLLSLLHPTLRTAKLPSELRQQKNKPIQIRIGRAIPQKEQKNFPGLPEYGAFLRQRTYLLKEALAPDKPIFRRLRPESPEPVAQAVPTASLLSEIEDLRRYGNCLLQQREYEVFFCVSEQIPRLLTEVGRLREETFRAVGEGSNKALDLDEFDYHYHHLLLWHREEERLLGAYRLGLGPEIFERRGIEGFYTHTLFRIKKKAWPLFSRSLEMGRAFIVADQQQKPLPLYLLWEGIKVVIHQNEDLQFIVGCASISNRFSRFSKSLMVEFLLKHYGDSQLAQLIKPRKAFKPKLKDVVREEVFRSTHEDLNKFDRQIEELEPGDMRFPVLIKKYLKQNGKIVCFNVDPLFNNSLDGFMYINIKDLPEETLKRES